MDKPDPPSPQPKIIVDEDWKSQVAAEREAAAHQSPPASEPSPSPDQPPMPDASLSVLITTLATQAMMALGQTPMPDQEKLEANLPFAKHCIDTLAVLADKTKGNLTSAEDHLLSRFLYELRLLYVAVQQQVAQPEGHGAA